jgi:hypothetical protein
MAYEPIRTPDSHRVLFRISESAELGSIAPLIELLIAISRKPSPKLTAAHPSEEKAPASSSGKPKRARKRKPSSSQPQ